MKWNKVKIVNIFPEAKIVENLENWNGRTCRVVIRFESSFFEWFRFLSFFWWWFRRIEWIRHFSFESISFFISGPLLVNNSWTDFTTPLGISENYIENSSLRKVKNEQSWIMRSPPWVVNRTSLLSFPSTFTQLGGRLSDDPRINGIVTILVIYSYKTLVLKCESDVYHVKISEKLQNLFYYVKMPIISPI